MIDLEGWLPACHIHRPLIDYFHLSPALSIVRWYDGSLTKQTRVLDGETQTVYWADYDTDLENDPHMLGDLRPPRNAEGEAPAYDWERFRKRFETPENTYMGSRNVTLHLRVDTPSIGLYRDIETLLACPLSGLTMSFADRAHFTAVCDILLRRGLGHSCVRDHQVFQSRPMDLWIDFWEEFYRLSSWKQAFRCLSNLGPQIRLSVGQRDTTYWHGRGREWNMLLEVAPYVDELVLYEPILPLAMLEGRELRPEPLNANCLLSTDQSGQHYSLSRIRKITSRIRCPIHHEDVSTLPTYLQLVKQGLRPYVDMFIAMNPDPKTWTCQNVRYAMEGWDENGGVDKEAIAFWEGLMDEMAGE